ncbi:MAG: class I SAM-dependent methyltransferase [Candidatus Doudnabacteria bacterium]|nr:class I SAM-dependent methyltransferase [Candidatus Doudnabacteria bacterium]
MTNAYQDPKIAQFYLDFLNSENGLIQQNFLWEAILPFLSKNENIKILDAACGSGWLTFKLSTLYKNIQGCDISLPLITFAQKQYPRIAFFQADLAAGLPDFEDNFFDSIILNMAAPDLNDLAKAFKNLSEKLKINGNLILTIPNPCYTYPVAEWKKGLMGFLLGRKPKLKIKMPYISQKNIRREFSGQKIVSNFYVLEDYLSTANKNNLQLCGIKEIQSNQDSLKFDLQYQLFRYPLLLLLVFKKLPQ